MFSLVAKLTRLKYKSPLNADLFFGVVVRLRYVFIDFLRAIMSEFPDYKKVSVEKLIPYARNSRTHSAEQVDQIAASIKEFGFLNPIITDGENGIVAGQITIVSPRTLNAFPVSFSRLRCWCGKRSLPDMQRSNQGARSCNWARCFHWWPNKYNQDRKTRLMRVYFYLAW